MSPLPQLLTCSTNTIELLAVIILINGMYTVVPENIPARIFPKMLRRKGESHNIWVNTNLSELEFPEGREKSGNKVHAV